jgi:hypothetical protein
MSSQSRSQKSYTAGVPGSAAAATSRIEHVSATAAERGPAGDQSQTGDAPEGSSEREACGAQWEPAPVVVHVCAPGAMSVCPTAWAAAVATALQIILAAGASRTPSTERGDGASRHDPLRDRNGRSGAAPSVPGGSTMTPTKVASRGRQVDTQDSRSERFADSAARRQWLASGDPLPSFGSSDSVSEGDGWFPPQYSGAGEIGDGLFSYQQLLSLPTSVPGLRARLDQAQAALAQREQHGLATKLQAGTGYASMQIIGHGSVRLAKSMRDLTTIATLLSTPVPATVRAALYRVAASLPEVTYDGKTTDTLGRPGVAISVGTSAHGMRMIFNPATGELLQTSAVIESSLHGLKLGTITQTIAAQGIAPSLNSLPQGVRPTGHMRPSPRTIAISPRAGTPTTTFRLTVHSTHASLPAAAASLMAQIDGPTAPGCRAYLLPPPIARLTRRVAIHTPGHVAYRYDLPSTAIGRSAWCPGRYQLQILANNQSCIYFEVR